VVDAKTSQVTARPVVLGAAQNGSVLISSGLKGGETVVTAGAHMLHAGQKVKPVASTRVASATQEQRP
jgi:multidrug efflux pump subunit AcrA (membrane-fusion protein)